MVWARTGSGRDELDRSLGMSSGGRDGLDSEARSDWEELEKLSSRTGWILPEATPSLYSLYGLYIISPVDLNIVDPVEAATAKHPVTGSQRRCSMTILLTGYLYWQMSQ